MNLPDIIGFAGYARVGKDTSAACVARLFPDVKVCQMGFADALKADLMPCITYFQSIGIDTTTDKFKKQFRMMWVLWSRICKDITVNERVWVERLHPRIMADCGCDSDGTRHIPTITDVRYWFEVEYIKVQNGLVLYIERPGFGPAPDSEEEDSFKVMLDFYPHLYENRIINDGTIDDLMEKIRIKLSVWSV